MTNPIDELIEKLPTGFTPGPWRFERHQRHSNWLGNIVGSYGPNERGNEQIRTITCQTRYGDPDERDANAALIALAPEMAAALSTLQEQKRKLEEALREQTGLVDRLLTAVECAEQDIGGERPITVLQLLGPVNDSARALLSGGGE